MRDANHSRQKLIEAIRKLAEMAEQIHFNGKIWVGTCYGGFFTGMVGFSPSDLTFLNSHSWFKATLNDCSSDMWSVG